MNEEEQSADKLVKNARERKAHLLKVQTFVLLVFSPMLVVIVGVLFFFYNEFRSMAISSEQLTYDVVPQIFNAQKVFINIDSLRYHLQTIHTTVSKIPARTAFVSAQSILTEIADNENNVDDSGTSVLMRQLQTF